MMQLLNRARLDVMGMMLFATPFGISDLSSSPRNSTLNDRGQRVCDHNETRIL